MIAKYHMKEPMNPTPRIRKNHQSERLIRNQQVAGSIPAGGSRTPFIRRRLRDCLLFCHLCQTRAEASSCVKTPSPINDWNHTDLGRIVWGFCCDFSNDGWGRHRYTRNCVLTLTDQSTRAINESARGSTLGGKRVIDFRPLASE